MTKRSNTHTIAAAVRRCVSPRHGLAMLVAMISLVFAPTARGHDATVMHVEAEARPGFVTLTFHLQQRDILQAVLKSNDADRFRDEDEFQAAADAIASFVKRGVRVTRGGKTIEPAPLSEWPPSRVTLTTKDPDGQLSATTIPFTIAFPIAVQATPTQPAPDNASRNTHNHDDVEIAFSLFEGTGLSATYSVSVWHPGMERSELAVLASRGTLLLPAILPGAATNATSPSAAPTSRSDTRPPEWTRGPIDTFAYFVPIGFEHIIPEGLDHILFVLGLFLLSPRLRPLLAQVTAFTVAHSITLALASLGVFRLPSSVVEPVIAISIGFVAVENIVTRKPHAWRWIIVFAFGLIHGLGFAGALSDVGLPHNRLVSALVGFNVGVELGQLAVIALAALALAWWHDRPWYRAWVSIPISSVIAAAALYWTVERIWF